MKESHPSAAKVDQLLDELLQDYSGPEAVLGEQGLLKQLTKRLVEKPCRQNSLIISNTTTTPRLLKQSHPRSAVILAMASPRKRCKPNSELSNFRCPELASASSNPFWSKKDNDASAGWMTKSSPSMLAD